MNESIHEALEGALVQELRLSILSNNISNINTVGFKEDLLFRIETANEEQEQIVLEDVPEGIPELSHGDLPVGTFSNFDQGRLLHTGNKLDLALEGNGFFCVETATGVQYTRKGNLAIDTKGILITQEGFQVIGKGGRIELNTQDFEVDGEGNIIVDGDTVDTIKIVDFDKPAGLQKMGATRFAIADPLTNEIKAEGFSVHQGFVESSNVDAVNAITEMIDVLRGYEAYQKVIQSLNDITLQAINEVGQLA